MLDSRLRRSASATIVTADKDNIRMSFRNSRRDCAYPHFRHQLYTDAGMMIGVLEIMNELGQILDRVDIMMWRRRNQPDTWRRVPHLGDPGIDFLAWQLAALTGFGTLGHLDLQFLC